MEEYKNKEVFVRTSLRDLLQDIDNGILDVYYMSHVWRTPDRTDWGEFVYIVFKDETRKAVDVTCDSLYGIAKDVLKHLWS